MNYISKIENQIELSKQQKDFIQNSISQNTVKAYNSDWRSFCKFCVERNAAYLPADPKTIADYLTYMANLYKFSTISRHLTVIKQAHETAGLNCAISDVTIKKLLKGIKNTLGIAAESKAPLMVEDLKKIVSVLPDTSIGLRDKALLLIGFAGAFRRSELVGITFNDLQFSNEGVIIKLKRSKTDQEGAGRILAIRYGQSEATCPILALQNWLSVAKITDGPIFVSINRHGQIKNNPLSPQSVALIIKKVTSKIGLNKDAYGGHSLRSGFVTSAANNNIGHHLIKQQTGHKTDVMVNHYIKITNIFKQNATNNIGL